MIKFQQIGRLPAAEDNCAIATRTLPAGTEIAGPHHARYALSHTILPGHRFAVQPIVAGAPLLSWGMTFGRALRDVAPGEYVCNAAALRELGSRRLDLDESTAFAELLPREPNFADDSTPYHFDPARFRPAPPLPREPLAHTFMGFHRPGRRGVGTRNMVVLLATNALVSGFVQQLAQELQSLASGYQQIDRIVAVAHTEGSQIGANNEELLLRTLAGFMVHPNVGAVLVLDAGERGVTNSMLRAYALENQYPLHDVPHQFLSLGGPFAADMARAMAVIKEWLPQVNDTRRTAHALRELKIALQCGGSDAFSGISGNPLAALVSKQVLQSGGTAVLAETDELIGAESYVLDKVRDVATAQRFLALVARFQEQAARHGHSAHGNPTGGNKYRGLYNIYLKSLGAATKRHPAVRLDQVIEYGQRIGPPGYYFMDSPGNDLESIAGQVAAGCNLIFFVTGNGSVTNFPFVPTIKIVTTSERYDLLAGEMDVNAGAYLDGVPLAELAEQMRELSLAVASGQRSAGEKAGHAQVQIWRNWPLAKREEIQAQPRPPGRPLHIRVPRQTAVFAWQGYRAAGGKVARDRIGLILPASLCSGQIARLAAQHLNTRRLAQVNGISHFAALVHTEGCGSSIEPELVNTLLGYMNHPSVAACLVLEHGCEITHNDFWRLRMREAGLDPHKVGWASVQLDGGIERVLTKIERWFTTAGVRRSELSIVKGGLRDVRLGLMAEDAVNQDTAVALAALAQQVAFAGGTAILPAGSPLAANKDFWRILSPEMNGLPTLAYGQAPLQPGFHLMASPTRHWSEVMTGLGATGVDLIVGLCTTHVQPGHPFIPVLQVATESAAPLPFYADIDLLLKGGPERRLSQLLAQLSAVLSRTIMPKADHAQNISFQITRGQLGVSL